MTTATTQLNNDFSGQSFEPYNTTPPLALQHMASSIDANNLTTGGTVVSGGTVVVSGGVQVVSGGSETVLSGGSIVVSSGGTISMSSGAVLNGGTVIGASIENSASFVLNSATSITPAGSNLATAVTITTQSVQLGTAASTTGVALPASANVLGIPLLLINTGTAAIHVYGEGGDTIDGTAGTTGVTLTNAHRCFFTSFASGSFVSGPEGGVTS